MSKPEPGTIYNSPFDLVQTFAAQIGTSLVVHWMHNGGIDSSLQFLNRIQSFVSFDAVQASPRLRTDLLAGLSTLGHLSYSLKALFYTHQVSDPWVTSAFSFAMWLVPNFLGRKTTTPVNCVDFLGVAVSGVGLVVHVGSIIQSWLYQKRKRSYKRSPAGRGFYWLTKDPGNFGILLFWTGISLVTRHPMSSVIPLGLLWMFIHVNPILEEHLQLSDPKAYQRTRHIARLLPFLW